MKATQVQPEPVALDVTLTMTAQEARALYRIAAWNITIPELMRDDATVGHDLAVRLLGDIRTALGPVVN